MADALGAGVDRGLAVAVADGLGVAAVVVGAGVVGVGVLEADALGVGAAVPLAVTVIPDVGLHTILPP